MPLLLLFIVLPLAELMIFGMVSARIGGLNALLLCVLAALMGGALIQHQGLKTLAALRESLQHNQIPRTEIFDGFCIVTAGILLIVPGFLTDLLGILLLLPYIRQIARGFIKNHTKYNVYTNASDFSEHRARSDLDIIEGEFENVEPDKNMLQPPTPERDKEP